MVLSRNTSKVKDLVVGISFKKEANIITQTLVNKMEKHPALFPGTVGILTSLVLSFELGH